MSFVLLSVLLKEQILFPVYRLVSTSKGLLLVFRAVGITSEISVMLVWSQITRLLLDSQWSPHMAGLDPVGSLHGEECIQDFVQ